MSRGTRIVEAAHVGTLAALVVVVGGDPTALMRRAPEWAGWLTGQQLLDRVMSRVAPPLFLCSAVAAVGAALVAADRHRGSLAAGRAVSAGCTAAAVAVTLVVHEPLNARIRDWRPQDAPPADWRAVRARWEQAHRYRRVLVMAAALASGLGALGARGRPAADG